MAEGSVYARRLDNQPKGILNPASVKLVPLQSPRLESYWAGGSIECDNSRMRAPLLALLLLVPLCLFADTIHEGKVELNRPDFFGDSFA